ncbi:MAG TPA: hypothetical protein VEN81_13840 [Planctomycetota bacterium]|nr:hypothetical protein [Planctomycetota bacterium]
MASLKRILMGLILAGLVAVAVRNLAWAAPQEAATAAPVTHRWVMEFGMVTPASGQSVRLHAAHVWPADAVTVDGTVVTGGYPPSPCRVTLAFFDGQGTLIGTPWVATLGRGEATFVDRSFNADSFPPNPCRGVVWVQQPGPAGAFPPNPCAATLEVIGTSSGVTTLNLLPAVQHTLAAIP